MPILPIPNDADAGGAAKDGGRSLRSWRRPRRWHRNYHLAPAAGRSPRGTSCAFLGETDRAAGTGDIGAILRREGVYSSTLCDWRRQRDAGAFGALTPVKRGPKAAEPNPLAAEVALLRKDNAHLTRRLVRADAIIAVQKKLSDLLGVPLAPNGDEP